MNEKKKLRDYTIGEIVEECSKEVTCIKCKFKMVHKFFCSLCAIYENLPKEIFDKEV